jgi:Fe-S-cluster containining protein
VESIPATATSGKCAFLASNNRCSIYEHRPAVCRSFGMPIKWAEGTAEARDICELNEIAFPDVTLLHASACWDMDQEDEALRQLQLRDQGAADGLRGDARAQTITLDDLHAEMVRITPPASSSG